MSDDYDYELIRNDLLQNMKKSKQWAKLRVSMEVGDPLGTNVNAHIAHFKEIVYASGKDLEDEEIKKLFLNSLPIPYHPCWLRNPDGTVASFHELERMAKAGKNFDDYFKQHATDTIAAITSRASFGQSKEKRVKCYVCHRYGHLAKDCKYQIQQKGNDHPTLADSSKEKKRCLLRRGIRYHCKDVMYNR